MRAHRARRRDGTGVGRIRPTDAAPPPPSTASRTACRERIMARPDWSPVNGFLRPSGSDDALEQPS